jgi:hypothetical protein
MISVRCPACGKTIGFDESDAGSLVACPHCRQSFFVPAVAVPVAAAPPPPVAGPAAPPVAPRLPQEPSLPDPDEIRIVDDPDLEPIPQQLDEVLPAEEPAPPPEPEPTPAPEPTPEPQPAPEPDPFPRLELDSTSETIETVEPIGTPTEVEPTDLAPSLSAAAVLSQSLPEKKEPDRPTEVLEEVADEEEDEDRFYDELEPVSDEADEPDKRRRRERDDESPPRRAPKKREDDESPPRRAPKKREDDESPPRRTPKKRANDRAPDGPSWTELLTRNRVLGGIGVLVSGFILLGLVLHHVTASSEAAWHKAVCCGDVFALALLGVGLYFVIRG